MTITNMQAWYLMSKLHLDSGFNRMVWYTYFKISGIADHNPLNYEIIDSERL